MRDLLGLEPSSSESDNYDNCSESREEQWNISGCLFRNNCINYHKLSFDIFNKENLEDYPNKSLINVYQASLES